MDPKENVDIEKGFDFGEGNVTPDSSSPPPKMETPEQSKQLLTFDTPRKDHSERPLSKNVETPVVEPPVMNKTSPESDGERIGVLVDVDGVNEDNVERKLTYSPMESLVGKVEEDIDLLSGSTIPKNVPVGQSKQNLPVHSVTQDEINKVIKKSPHNIQKIKKSEDRSVSMPNLQKKLPNRTKRKNSNSNEGVLLFMEENLTDSKSNGNISIKPPPSKVIPNKRNELPKLDIRKIISEKPPVSKIKHKPKSTGSAVKKPEETISKVIPKQKTPTGKKLKTKEAVVNKSKSEQQRPIAAINGKGNGKKNNIRTRTEKIKVETTKPKEQENTPPEWMLKKVVEWNAQNVSNWVCTLGKEYKKYGKSFQKNHIIGDILNEVGYNHLKDLGVTSIGHRLMILKKIKKLARQ